MINHPMNQAFVHFQSLQSAGRGILGHSPAIMLLLIGISFHAEAADSPPLPKEAQAVIKSLDAEIHNARAEAVLKLEAIQAKAVNRGNGKPVPAIKTEIDRIKREMAGVGSAVGNLPVPKLVMKGTENYEVRGNSFTRYRLSITNRAEYPDELFSPAPDLPPSGLNTNAARTWVAICDSSNRYIYGFSAFTAAADLDRLWFAMPQGKAPPAKVYVELHDRRSNRKLKSNLVETTPAIMVE